MTDERNETSNGIVRDVRSDSETVMPEASGGGGRGPFDLNTQQKRLLLVILVVHLILARFTLRDLRRRPASAVRGPKRLWRGLGDVEHDGVDRLLGRWAPKRGHRPDRLIRRPLSRCEVSARPSPGSTGTKGATP